MDTISPVYARFVLRELRRRGVAQSALFAGTRLNSDELQAGGDIDVQDFVALLNNAKALTGDDTLGLMIGRHTHVVALGPVGAAMAAAPTLRQGLQALENFSRLHASHVDIELASNLRGLSISFRFMQSLGEVERFHADTAVLAMQNYVEMVTGQRLEDALYLMGFTDPGNSREYAAALHSPCRFGNDHTAVELPRRWLDLHSPYFNAEIWHQAQLMLARRIGELGTDGSHTYTQHLSALLRSCEPPLPDLSAIVQKLHTSERTLNRRLRQEGTNFRDIKGLVLNTWARRYLTETDLSVEAIAAALGYGDTANFRRAFRSREGCSPGEFRKLQAL